MLVAEHSRPRAAARSPSAPRAARLPSSAHAGTRPRSAPHAARLLADGAGLLLVVPLWVWWAMHDGGFPATVFLPGVAYLAAVTALACTVLPRPPLRSARLVTLAAMGAFALWTALSLLWADDRGGALVGAERAWLAVGALALPLLWPPSRSALAAAVGAWVLAATAGAVAGLVAVLGGAQGALPDGRLAAPTGYVNASAALFVMGAFPALVVAGRRELPAWARIGGLALGGGLAATAVLSQSRGIVAVAVVAAGLVVALSPARLRALAPFALAGLAIGLAREPLLGLRTGMLDGLPGDAGPRAALAVLGVTAALAAAGVVLVAVDGRWRPDARRVRRASWALGVAALGVIGLGAGALAGAGGPADWVSARWSDFRTPDYVHVEAGATRFGGGLGSNRYDYWRVAVDGAARRPLTGAGVEQFAATYFRGRRSEKAPRYAHNLWLGTAAELGLPGLAVLMTAFGALGAAVIRTGRGSPPGDRALRVAAVLPLTVLLLHATADWTFSFPGLAVPALGLAAGAAAPAWNAAAPEERAAVTAAAAAPAAAAWNAPTPQHRAAVAAPNVRTREGRPDVASVGRARPGAPGMLTWALAAVLAVAAAVAVPLWLSERLVERAAATAGARPAGALADLRRAARLNPIGARPELVRGVVALELGRRGIARQAFAQAARRDPSAWYPRLALALLDAAAAPRRAAAELAAASVRNPADAVIRAAGRSLAAGHVPDPLQVQRTVLSQPG